MNDFFNSNMIIIIGIIMIIIISINYELKNFDYDYYENIKKTESDDYALLLSENIIKDIYAIQDPNIDKNQILQNCINKFIELNVITKNTTSGQKLVLYLQRNNRDDTNISHKNITSIVDNIMNNNTILLEIIYPILIFVKN